MPFRPRFTDAFALVGLLLLITSVPAYVAQDDEARPYADGFTFTTGTGRLGSSIEFEVLFEPAEGEPVLVGPVARHELRAPAPGEGPAGAAYGYMETIHAIHLEFPWGRVKQDAHFHVTWFDDSGVPLWRDDEHLSGTGEDRHLSTRGARIVSGDDPWMSDETNVKTNYHPSPGTLAFKEIGGVFRHELVLALNGDPGRHPESAHRLVIHRGAPLFSVGGSALEGIFGAQSCVPRCIGSHHLEVEVELPPGAGGDPVNAYPEHRWRTPDWPLEVGVSMHHFAKSSGDVRLVQTVLPKAIHVGEGATVTFRDYQTRFGEGSWVLSRTDADLSIYTLGFFSTDPRPLLRTIGFDDLLAAARSEQAPEEVRRFAATAYPVEFAWIDGPVETDAPEPADGIAGLLGEDAPVVAKRYHSTWFVTLARPDGAVRVVMMELVEAEGVELRAAQDICGEGSSLEQDGIDAKCGPLEPGLIDQTRRVADPWKLIDRALADRNERAPDLPSDPPLAEFAYLPLARMESIDHRYVALARGNYTLSPGFVFFPPWFSSAVPGDDLLLGLAQYRHGDETEAGTISAAFDLRDGAPLALYETTPMHAAPASAPAPTLTSGAALRALDVAPANAVTGGIFLVALSVLVRLVSSLKAGSGLPVIAILYAKLARSEVLLHARRDHIMGLLSADPGLTASEVTRMTGFGWGATVHHLETLVKNGHLVAVVSGGRRHYFRADEGTRMSRVLAAARRDEQAATLLDAVAARPGASVKELAEMLQRSTSSLSRTGSRLAKLGLLRKERDGMSVRLWTTAEGAGPAVAAAPAPGIAAE